MTTPYRRHKGMGTDAEVPLVWRPIARHVVVGTDVVVLAEGASHVLEGPAYGALAPLLAEGSYTEAELWSRVEGMGIPRSSARLATGYLRACDLVCEAN